MKKFMKNNTKIITRVLFIIFIIVRLWFLSGSNWYVNIESYFDSHLEINSAINIIAGNWMGATYNKFILCKNPSYPLFLALLYILHIPYPIGIGLLMILSSVLFIKAIKPLIKNEWIELLFFALILFNPVGFSHEAIYHYRNSLVPWAVLAVISSLVAIYLRKDEKIKKILPWSLCGMLFTGFFWLLREDSIWFLPFILVAFIVTELYWILNKVKIKKLLLYSLLAIMPLSGILISNIVVSNINYNYYGIFATNDRTKTSEAKVLGLLIKIDDGSNLDKDVWVSKKSIKLAKKASPTFASLELKAFDNWPKIGDYSIWALRDSLADSGYYTNAKKTEKMYKKIASELESAFKSGKLKKKKGIQLSSTSGIYSKKEILKPLPIGLVSLKNHLIYKSNSVELEKIDFLKNEEELHVYEKLLGIDLINITPELQHTNIKDIKDETMLQNKNKLRSLYHNMFLSNIIISCYRYTGIIFFILGFIGYIYLIIKLIKKDKRIDYKFEVFIVMTGLLLTTYLNSYLVGLWGIGFNLTANDELFEAYTTVQYITIQLFELLGIIFFYKLIKEKKNTKKVVKKNGKK